MNIGRFLIKSPIFGLNITRSIYALTYNIQPTVAVYGIRDFEFASMQNLKYSEAMDRFVRPGLYLCSCCKNESCDIYNDNFVCNFDFGIFDAEYLNISCRCPSCRLQFKPTGVGFYKANIYVDGIKQSGTKILYTDKISNCVYETNDDNTLWVRLIISVSKL